MVKRLPKLAMQVCLQLVIPVMNWFTACLEEELAVIALPGPTAGMTALIASGLLPQPFTFYGFTKKEKNRKTCYQH